MAVLNSDTTTWRKLIESHLSNHPGEELISITIADEALDKEFDSGYGRPEGEPFTAWTQNRVVFPWCYDGAEGVASAPRNPCDETVEHVGGY